MEPPAPSDLYTKSLIRRLCTCITHQALPAPRDPAVVSGLVEAQLDAAYSVLLGLDPVREGDPPPPLRCLPPPAPAPPARLPALDRRLA